MTSNYDECKKYANELRSEKAAYEDDDRNTTLAQRAQLDHNLALRGVIAHGLMAIADAIERHR